MRDKNSPGCCHLECLMIRVSSLRLAHFSCDADRIDSLNSLTCYLFLCSLLSVCLKEYIFCVCDTLSH